MPSQRDVQKFLKTARERFEQGQTATSKQRQRILDDLAFYAGGERQWDAETLKARKGQDATRDGLPPVPARPSMTINKVREPVHQVLNQERQSDMGIELVPADDWGDLAPPVSEEEIELREGLVRRIQRESEAADARTWAFMRAAIAGEGYYVVYTRFAPGKTRDKDVFVRRIFNQASVTLDPAHEQPDGSDAEWGFIGGDVPWERYKREFPKAKAASADDATFRALGEEYPGWYTETSTEKGTTRSGRVVEYFYTEWDNKTLYDLVDGQLLWEDELPDNLPDDQIVDSREVPQKTIKWAKIDATQILEETDWEGQDLPIIKVVGEELQPFDNERRVEGMVRPARDAQQGFNAMISKWVEMVGYAPIPPFQLEETNIGPYGNWYQLANTRALPFLPYIGHDATGNPLGPPTRTNVTTDIQAVAQSVQMFDEAIKSTTMVPNVQLGQATDKHLKAKGAILALQDQAQLGTSHFLDNLKRSIRYEGQIINNLLFPIYGRPGRLARMLTGENEPKAVRISEPPAPSGAPYGQPGAPSSASVPGVPPLGPPANAGAGPMGAAPMGAPPLPPPAAPPKTYTLTKDANFNVLVKVTRSFDSRRAEEATTIGTLLESNGQLMSWFGDLFFKNQDGPGHEEMADRAKVMLDPKITAMLQAKEQGQDGDPQAQAQLSAMKQQLDKAHEVMAQAQKELKEKQDQKHQELEAKAQLEREKWAHEKEMQRMKDATAIRVAELGAKKDVLQGAYEDQEEALALAQEHAHEAGQAELDRQHEIDKAQLGHAQALEAGAQGHAQALEAGAQPPPVDPNRPQPETADPSTDGASS